MAGRHERARLGGCLADDMAWQDSASHRSPPAPLGGPPGGAAQAADAQGGRRRAQRPEREAPGGEVQTRRRRRHPRGLPDFAARELGKRAPQVCPSVPVRRFHGGDRDSATGRRRGRAHHLRRPAPEKEALAQAGFSMVVADEAQHAKNPLSDTAKSLRSVPAQARIALTGTPVENRLTELWSSSTGRRRGCSGPWSAFAAPLPSPSSATMTRRRRTPGQRRTPVPLAPQEDRPHHRPDLPSDGHRPGCAANDEQVSLYEAEVREALHAIATKSGIERQGLVLRLLTC